MFVRPSAIHKSHKEKGGGLPTSLYEILTPFSCLEFTTFNPLGVGGKYCATAALASETTASQVVGTIAASGESRDKSQKHEKQQFFQLGDFTTYE